MKMKTKGYRGPAIDASYQVPTWQGELIKMFEKMYD
jgi:hypothetical protein